MAASGWRRADVDRQRLLDDIAEAARDAGEAILEIVRRGFEVEAKADASPVTEADRAAELIILAALARSAPGVPVIAEEEVAAGRIPAHGSTFFLVDPLDGTKEFVARNGGFSINIGLVEDRRPVLGVIHVPVKRLTYAASGPGTATRQEGDAAPTPVAARPPPAAGLVVAHSRSHANSAKLDAFLADLRVAERLVSGSAYKFCLIAEGTADLYPRFGPTMEWDTAAGQAILEAAGGSVTTMEGAPFLYGKPGFLNSHFVARGR